jgi:hypothetical protein
MHQPDPETKEIFSSGSRAAMSGRHGHISGREMAVHGVCLMIWNTFADNWNRPFNRVDLGEDEVHVWLAPLDQDAAAVSELAALLAPDECRRAEKYYRFTEES